MFCAFKKIWRVRYSLFEEGILVYKVSYDEWYVRVEKWSLRDVCCLVKMKKKVVYVDEVKLIMENCHTGPCHKDLKESNLSQKPKASILPQRLLPQRPKASILPQRLLPQRLKASTCHKGRKRQLAIKA